MNLNEKLDELAKNFVECWSDKPVRDIGPSVQILVHKAKDLVIERLKEVIEEQYDVFN